MVDSLPLACHSANMTKRHRHRRPEMLLRIFLLIALTVGLPTVRAVTERLRLGPAARAPEIGARLNLLDERGFLRHDRIAHGFFVAAGGRRRK